MDGWILDRVGQKIKMACVAGCSAKERVTGVICSTCKPHVELHLPVSVDMSPKIFFSQSFFGEAKKGAGVLHQALLRVSQKMWWHSSTHGCAWAHLGVHLFSHFFLCQKRNRGKKASELSAPSVPYQGIFPAREKRKLAGHKALGTVSLSHVNAFVKMASLAPTNTVVTLDTCYCF